MIQTSRLWCITLLSALAFNAAWLCHAATAWLVIPGVLLLCLLQGPARTLVWHGVVWGLLVFSFHFHWLLMLQHDSAAGRVACFVAAALYLTVVTAGWFGVMSFMRRWWMRVAWLALFWVVIDRWIFLPVGLCEGYPLLSPCVPLARYRWFLLLLSWLVPAQEDAVSKHLCYVQPVVNRVWHRRQPWAHDPHITARRACQLMQGHYQPGLTCVSPESGFIFPLNRHPGLVERLTAKTMGCKELLVGGPYEKGGTRYQAVYQVAEGLIINFYVKKQLVPFAEALPPLFQHSKLAERMIAKSPCAVAGGDLGMGAAVLQVAGCRVLPALCWEFFCMQRAAAGQCQVGAVLAFVNDSWYNQLFRLWLVLLARLKSQLSGVPVVYIGHYGCYTMEPTFCTITPLRSCYASVHA